MKQYNIIISVTGLLFALCASPPEAKAQINMATVVSSCGTPPSTYTAGFPYPLTQTTGGLLCLGGGGSSGANVNLVGINGTAPGSSNPLYVAFPSAGGGIVTSQSQIYVGGAFANHYGVTENGTNVAYFDTQSTGSNLLSAINSGVSVLGTSYPTTGLAIALNYGNGEGWVGDTNGGGLVFFEGAAGTPAGGVATVQGATASYASPTEDPLYNGCRAQTAIPATLATDGQKAPIACGQDGRVVTVPYAVSGLWLYGTVTITASTGATNITGFGSQGAGVAIYIVDGQCSRSDAGTGVLNLTFNDAAGSNFGISDYGNGGGNNPHYSIPIKIPAATQATLTSDTSVTSVKCSFQAYKGPG